MSAQCNGHLPAALDGGQALDLSVLVTSYDGADRLARFLPVLAGAAEAVGTSTEVVVVDNGSTDGTAEAAMAAVPSARVVRIAPNRGASGGRNAAARAAGGRWFLLCDDDVEVSGEALTALWEARRPGHCLVPLVRDLRGALQNSVVARWRLGDHKLYELPEPVDEVAYPVGACLLVERQLYWAVGAFDERYQPNGYEDAAFGYALREAGASIRMVPEATVVHHVHGRDEPGERPRSFEAHREEYRERIYRTRWLFALLALRGWRRWMVVSLGVPRTLLEALRECRTGPVRGYVAAWRTFLADRWHPARSFSPAGKRHRRTRRRPRRATMAGRIRRR